LNIGFIDWAACVNCSHSDFDPDDAEVPNCGKVDVKVLGNDVVCKNYFTGDNPEQGEGDADME
jgi:hypothetical protein